VVTARVQRQVAGLFVAEERGSHELKGVPERYPNTREARPQSTSKPHSTPWT
jgi:hypothetical protein